MEHYSNKTRVCHALNRHNTQIESNCRAYLFIYPLGRGPAYSGQVQVVGVNVA